MTFQGGATHRPTGKSVVVSIPSIALSLFQSSPTRCLGNPLPFLLFLHPLPQTLPAPPRPNPPCLSQSFPVIQATPLGTFLNFSEGRGWLSTGPICLNEKFLPRSQHLSQGSLSSCGTGMCHRGCLSPDDCPSVSDTIGSWALALKGLMGRQVPGISLWRSCGHSMELRIARHWMQFGSRPTFGTHGFRCPHPDVATSSRAGEEIPGKTRSEWLCSGVCGCMCSKRPWSQPIPLMHLVLRLHWLGCKGPRELPHLLPSSGSAVSLERKDVRMLAFLRAPYSLKA